jgi:hypothetical protein
LFKSTSNNIGVARLSIELTCSINSAVEHSDYEYKLTVGATTATDVLLRLTGVPKRGISHLYGTLFPATEFNAIPGSNQQTYHPRNSPVVTTRLFPSNSTSSDCFIYFTL